ncbi:UNVERIFIED_CONTAM: hypothetical protein PYX00_009382 [Menopon gallinae]|uniref:Uncharacterized protein n=1 Tax=Menopon gallinae TaxID=328185 RepID=A0AAW2HB65_9NEOP
MSRTIGFLIVQCLFLAIAVNGAPESVSEETPDFFSMTAKHVSEMIRKQLMSTFTDEASRRNERAAEEEGSEEEGNPSKPELHYSTLRGWYFRF